MLDNPWMLERRLDTRVKPAYDVGGKREAAPHLGRMLDPIRNTSAACAAGKELSTKIVAKAFNLVHPLVQNCNDTDVAVR